MVNIETVHTSNDLFRVGDVITITENGGTGVATATVASIHDGQKIGAVATVTAFNTDNPFDVGPASGIAVILSSNAGLTTQQGQGVTGTATTAGPTLLDSVQIINGGSGFMVGDIIDVQEDGGSGLGHVTVTTLA